jgi:LacI family repressor for deo operon, udp, cdd, tsx, nupC, and nupG
LTAQGRLQSRWRAGIFVKESAEHEIAVSNQTVALVAELATNPFSATILAGAAERAALYGYNVMLAVTNDDPEIEAKQIGELADSVRGTIVVPVNRTESHVAAFSRVLARHRHLVFVDHYIEGIDAPRVTSDNILGGYLATKHLLECGCKRVYALTSGRHTTSSRERLTGHTQALQERGYLFDPSLMVHSPEVHYIAGQTLTREILERESGTKKLGIFAINDVMAAGAYLAIKQAGLRIPDDVAVVGYDDIHGAMMDPPLTSVRQDLLEMGRSAMQVLLNLIEGKSTDIVRVPVELIVRASTVGDG